MFTWREEKASLTVQINLMLFYVWSNHKPDQTLPSQLVYYAPGDDSPHGGILLLLCPYVCMYVCMYVRVRLKFLVKVFG